MSGDIQAPPAPGDFLFVKTDVKSWADLTKLFKVAKEKHGRVDYVFANAGIGPRANYLELEVDANGDPVEPNRDTLDINLNSVVNTAMIAAHHIKSQPEGGSIVLMASSTALHPVRAVDYGKSSLDPLQTPTDTLLSNCQIWRSWPRSWFRTVGRSCRSAHSCQHPDTFMDRNPSPA